jgi:hypothetical protein
LSADTEILDGLSENETAVADPSGEIKDGVAITPR